MIGKRRLLALILVASAPSMAFAQSQARSSPQAPAQTLSRCDRLIAYYDRYADQLGEGKTPAGRFEREFGQARCAAGDQADGVRLLEEAIRKAGHRAPAG